ncbi:MAG: N-acetylmuramic acid 6-phosphate etherase [Trueperaceae bacterium]|nr:N-acetylmuramic acid 6-phosphate etherase [Trueperaceae bacterium]
MTLNTERTAERYQDLDSWSLGGSLAALTEANLRALRAVEAALPALTRAAEALSVRLERGGRLVYVGAGTSGRIAVQDAAELVPTFGFRRTEVLIAGGSGAEAHAVEGAEDDQDAARRAVDNLALGDHDALIGIAASGRTPYTVAAIAHAGHSGVLTVGIANNPSTPLLGAAEIAVLLDTGPEVLAGSTRLAAGTAQKAALNALSTSVLVGLGGAYQNLMVGMTPTNDKLRDRAVQIVCQATGTDPGAATQTLTRSDYDIRAAIVMLKTGLPLADAQHRLEHHNQRVRAVLAEFGLD